ncbi:MAG: hypothetical protein KBI30_00495 [Candidatus Atribacteria bacterium]|nr:hypothetical protein [Candidatus Atribacteria bacterium]
MKNEHELDTLIMNFFDEFYYTFSSKATLHGIHRYDYKLSSFKMNDLNSLKALTVETLSNIKSLEAKNPRDPDIKTFKKILLNTLDFISDGYKSSLQFIVGDILDGIISVALTAAKPTSIKSRNFTNRLTCIKEYTDLIRDNFSSISGIEKKAVLKELDFLENFIDAASSYLLTKSDSEKKELLKNEKINIKEDIDYLRKTVSNIRSNEKVNLSALLRYLNIENTDFADLKNFLQGNLDELSSNIVKKSREIKISAPYFETLASVSMFKEKLDDSQIEQLLQTATEVTRKYFNKFNAKIDLSIYRRNFDIIPFLENNKKNIITFGEFDIKKFIAVIIQDEGNKNYLMQNIVREGIPGKAVINFYRQKEKNIKKYFNNYIFYEGFSAYVKRTTFSDFKNIFASREFELLYFYDEYVYTLKAFLENEMYFRGISDIEIENLVKQDKILIDKDNFLTELIIDEGKSFLGMQGYHKILEIEKYERKSLGSGLVQELKQAIYYPFYLYKTQR